MAKQRGLWLSLAGIALFLLVGRAVAGAYSDYRWYEGLGALDVWSLRVGSATMLRLAAFLVASLAAFANLWGVRHSVVSLVLPRRLANIEIGEEVPGRTLMSVVATVAVVMGAMFAGLATDWHSFALARHGVAFRESDPYFGADVGLFVYWLPFERAAYAWFVVVTAVVTLTVIALYALTPSLRWERGRLHVSTYVRRHFAILGGVAIALVAWSFRLDAYSALIAGSGADGAFGAMDHQFHVPISLILAYASVGTAFVVAWAGWTGQTRIAFTVMTVLLLLVPTMRIALPVVVRWASTPVDPTVRERAYAADRSGFTRRAYGVDRIQVLPDSVALSELESAAVTSVWDPVPLTRALERSRRRGPVIGAPALVRVPPGPAFLSIEMPPANDAGGLAQWTPLRTLAAVTDERGGIVRVTAAGGFPLDEPPIGPVLVYEGARGALLLHDSIAPATAPSLAPFGARLLHAWSAQNVRFLSSANERTRLVTRRDVRDRVRALTPFFSQGTRIVPLVHGDSLMWTVELYSTTANYPLARRFAVVDGEVSYLRHAATALVHAYTGRVTFIPAPDPDPIAKTWITLLPSTLSRPPGIAPSLLALLPPDVDGAELQAEALASAGVRGEASVRRHIPAIDGSDTLVTAHAATVTWLPTIDAPVWTVPLLDADERLTGMLIATGGAHRRLYRYRFAESSITWEALLERLRTAADAEQPRGADQGASGRVRILPMSAGRWLAIQPRYSWPGDAPPTVRVVTLAYGDLTRAAGSVAAVVGAPAVAGPTPTTVNAREMRIRSLYAEMRAALQRGDWRTFGAAFDALGALLDRR